MIRSLIVGGSGFVGVNLTKKLLQNKKYSISSTYFKNNNFKKLKNIKYFKGNLLNFDFCKKITKNIDEIYMCAAFTAGAKIINNNPINFVHDNTIMNLNILKSASENNIKKFIFISSSVVYPDKGKKMNENDVDYSFFNKYENISWMKVYSEKICEMYTKKFDVLVVRPSNLYGPHDKFDIKKSKVIPSLIRKFVNNKFVEVWGDGKEVKDFIYVEDFINILLKLKNKTKKFNVVNIASGKQVTILDLVNIIGSYYPNKKIIFLKNNLKMISVRKLNINKMKKLTNYKLKFNMYNGIEKTLNWYKKNLTIYK